MLLSLRARSTVLPVKPVNSSTTHSVLAPIRSPNLETTLDTTTRSLCTSLLHKPALFELWTFYEACTGCQQDHSSFFRKCLWEGHIASTSSFQHTRSSLDGEPGASRDGSRFD